MNFSNVKCLSCHLDRVEGETDLERTRRKAMIAFQQHTIHYEIMQLHAIAMMLNNTTIELTAEERKLFATKIESMIQGLKDILPQDQLTDREYEEFVKIRRIEAHRAINKHSDE